MASLKSSLNSEPTTVLRHRSHISESENATDNHPSSQQNTNFNNSEVRTEYENHVKGFENISTNDDSDKSSNAGQESKSLLGYFMTELTKHYRLEADASEFVERRDRVYTSVYTPKNLEKFLAFGFLQCLDSILYMVTFLPLRILVALMRLLTYPCTLIFVGRRSILDASQVCDLLKGLILVVSCYITSQVDMSMIYHIVRGQSIMKFYVFFNMLDVMDKLVSQFGQDILDSLYWTAVEPRGRKREHFGTFFHLVFATVYVIAHTMMILMQAIILNVAFNSHNKNLLTVMMSNNFVEIKVNVFKRVDKTNLCQITYSDVRERFHYMVLLFFVFVRNMKELQWNWDMALPLLQDAAIVFLVEVFVDWIKHAFITKLSELSASHYGEFSLGLAQDIASSQKKHAFTNFSDQVCRRMGFTPMPLICLLYMVCCSSFTVEGPLAWSLVFLLYICLMSTKILNSIILLGWAQRLITERDKTAQPSGTVVNSQTHPKKEAGKKPTVPKPDSQTEKPVTRLSESDTGLYNNPVVTDPCKEKVSWSSSFTTTTLDPATGLSSAAWECDGLNVADLKSSSSFLIQPSSSLTQHQATSIHNHPVVESSTIRGLQKDTEYLHDPHEAPAVHSFTATSQNVNTTPAFPSTTTIPFTNTPRFTNSNSASDILIPGPIPSQPPSHTADLNIPVVSPVAADCVSSSLFANPPVSSNSVMQPDRTHCIPSVNTSNVDSNTESPSVCSPKRKHSATSINSADSFFLENPDPAAALATEATVLNNPAGEGDCQNTINTSFAPSSELLAADEKLSQVLKPSSADSLEDVSSSTVSDTIDKENDDCRATGEAKIEVIYLSEAAPQNDEFLVGECHHVTRD
ncbi:transmembrane anterior posterior transformation protein 1-like protein [Plakobranchus ocellatus]|uniref:Transmembrane anterior posterior transformation protein 1-like protein n=1 Tax=Plakobranchus ocellatus TaxID=259542 RepID=A0AAV4CV99_9GAST|nr:transmembrane anterior posterior transformation protein 1-like protein [Plakobranchus ocellatus]